MNPVAAAMAAEMQLDFAFICTEHMPLGRTEISMMCQFYKSHGISPIVRVPSADPAGISMVLDGGAEGIVVPYVETPEQVRQIVGAVKYRPIKGQLLQQAIAGQSELNAKTREFLADFNRQQYVIIGIESVSAIENLESLITAADVDGVFLGPHDITTSMGIPTEYDNPKFVDTVEDIVHRCRQHSVGVGLHTMLMSLPPKTLRRFLDAGMNFLINGADIVAMRDAMNLQLAQLRELNGDRYERNAEVDADLVKSCIT